MPAYQQACTADVGLMFVAYNLRRIINILGKDVFKAYLEVLVFPFPFFFPLIRAILSRFKQSVFPGNMKPSFFDHPANQLIFTGNFVIVGGFQTDCPVYYGELPLAFSRKGTLQKKHN